MSPERDPELGATLEEGLPPATAAYGQKERVRRALGARLAPPRGRAPAFAVALALVACLVAVVALMAVAGRSRSLAVARPDAPSVVALARARVVVRARGEISIDHDDASGTLLRLVSGTILVHVRKETGLPFEVVSGSTTVHVVGTVFGVESLPAGGAALVQVLEGVVRVTSPSGAVEVRAGEAWPPRSGDISATVAELALLELRTLEAGSAPVRSRDLPRAASAAPGPTDAGPLVTARRPAARRPVDAPAPDPYATAKALERSGDLDGALRAYAALASAAGPNAEDALFAMVRLKAQRGAHSEVVAAVAAYRSAFPDGRYARAVDVHAVNALLSLPDDDGVIREAEPFLRRFPGDPRAWRFHLARATSLVRRGDCRAAVADLAQVPDSDAKQSVLAVCSGR